MTQITSRIVKTEPIEWRQLRFLQQEDFKDWSIFEKEKLKKSLVGNHFSQPFYVWEESAGILYCLDGFHRTQLLHELIEDGHQVPDLLPATFIECTDRKEAAKLVLQYSSVYAKVTHTGLLDFLEAFQLPFDEVKFEINLPDFDPLSFESALQGPVDTDSKPRVSLQERFLIPPFSILDSRQGVWQDRKRKWHEIGFNSQESREDVEIINTSGQAPAVYELRNSMREQLGREPTWEEILDQAKQMGLHVYEGASIFDPVLCEVMYKWFCTPAGSILDPFAGGSVRGIVAGLLGYEYAGIELRTDQVEANRRQWETVKDIDLQQTSPRYIRPEWMIGDSMDMQYILPDGYMADFLFSCPPYHDLEQYSDNPADLSNMPWEKFLENYRGIIMKGCQRLKEDRFAVFVVGEIRDKKGYYRDFVGETIQAFRDAGLAYYNEMILINPVGSMAIRVGRQFAGFRKIGKTHQNVLVFFKGNPKTIKDNFPEIETEDTAVSEEKEA